MAALLKLIVAIGLALTAVPWCAWLVYDAWMSTPSQLPTDDQWPVLGGAIAAAIWIWWKRPNWLIHTFIHECCHALMATALLVRVHLTSLRVSNGKGGSISHTQVDPVRTTLIAIAPYTLPLLLAAVLIPRMVVTEPSTARSVLSALCAFFAIHHLHALYHNIRINISGSQSDLVLVGRPLSAVLIACALLATGWWVLLVLW